MTGRHRGDFEGMSPLVAREHVLKTLQSEKPSSYAIIAAPGSGGAQLLRNICSEFEESRRSKDLIAQISTDRCNNEKSFVQRLIEQWQKNHPDLEDAWGAEQARPAVVSQRPELQLETFCSLAAEFDYQMYAFVDKFDRVFRFMSGELLATLRELAELATGEGAKACLVMVNVSKYQYEHLFSVRKRTDPSFTSEFGGQHIPLFLGPLDVAEAYESWKRDGLPTDRYGERLFHIAFDESGGLRDLFEFTKRTLPKEPVRDVRVIRASCREYMRNKAAPLLEYDSGHDDGWRQHLAALFETSNQQHDDRIFTNYCWGRAVCRPRETAFHLAIRGLGELALESLADTRKGLEQAQKYFRLGYYKACLRCIDGTSHEHERLRMCAELAVTVCGATNEARYLNRDTNWKKVKGLESKAGNVLRREGDRARFKNWSQIADACLAVPALKNATENEDYVARLANRDEAVSARDYLLMLGIRVVRVRDEQDPTVRLYTVLPLCEEVIRSYAAVVLHVHPRRILDDVSLDACQAVWGHKEDPFRKPAAGPLTGTHLAVGVSAWMYEKQITPPLWEGKQLEQYMTMLANDRNHTGHYFRVARKAESNKQVDECLRLYDRLCCDAEMDLNETVIREMLRLPGE